VLKANPRLQAARSRAGAFSARIGQAGAWDEPQVGVEFFATPVTSANPFRDGMETDFFIQQMIPLFGKKSLMSDAATAGAHMAGESAVAVERNLIADVKKAYSMIYAAQRRIDVNTENHRLLAQIMESARTRYRVGLISQGDLLKVQVEMAKLQNERSALEQELANACAMMNALRGRPADTPIGTVEDPSLAKITLSPEDLLARALEFRPELHAMGYELEMSRTDLAASRRERLPDVMVRGMYKRMLEGTDQWAAMFSINIPIAPWASGKSSGKIEENELVARATEQSLADMKNMVQAEVREAWSRVTAQWQQIERFQQTILPQSEQSLRSALTAFETGGVDFLSLLDSYRMFQMLKMDYYMRIGEYVSSVALLEKATGTDLR
jgi:outer membrane protein TolC